MKHYLIYKITCVINNKIYVGKHMTDNINDTYMGSGVLLRYEQDLFGLDKFKKEILFECSSEEEMNKNEAEIVNEDFIARDDVYNVMLGGDGGWNAINSNKQLKTLSAKKGGITTNKKIKLWPKEVQAAYWKKISAKVQLIRKSWTAEQKEQMLKKVSDSLKAFYNNGGKNPMLGKKHSNEARQKISITHMKEKNPQFGKMWICNDKTHESKIILKSEIIPDGWRKGRICKV